VPDSIVAHFQRLHCGFGWPVAVVILELADPAVSTGRFLDDSLDFEISSRSPAPYAANGIGAGGDVYGAQLLTSVQATPWFENVYNCHVKPINLDEYDAVYREGDRLRATMDAGYAVTRGGEDDPGLETRLPRFSRKRRVFTP
jgi:hypothetical protein